MKLSADLLASALGCAIERAELFADSLDWACERYEINTPERLAAFLAQVGHESGALRYTRELWGPTPVQQRYEGLPFTALNTPRDILLNVAASNLTFGGAYLAAYLIANTKTMALKTVASGAAVAAVPMDTTGTLNVSGCYLIET